MSNLQIFVIFSGMVMTILITWYFWFAPKAQTRVAVSASGAGSGDHRERRIHP